MIEEDLGSQLQGLVQLLDVGRHDEARDRAARLAVAFPERSEPPRYLAVALFNTGRAAKAREAAQEAVRRDPEDAASYRVLALVHQALRDRPRARESAERAVLLDPHGAQSWKALALVRDGEPEGIEAAHRAVELAPDDPNMHNALGIALLPSDRRAAREAFQRAMALAPASASIRSNLALADLRLGATGAAAEGFADSLRLDPRGREVVRNLRAVFVAWLVVAHVVVLWAAGLVNVMLFETDPGAVVAARVLWSLVVLAVVVFVAVRLRARSVPVRAHLVGSLRRDRPLLAWTLLLIAVAVGMLISLFVPGDVGRVLCGLTFLVVLLANISLWIANRRHR